MKRAEHTQYRIKFGNEGEDIALAIGESGHWTKCREGVESVLEPVQILGKPHEELGGSL